MSICTIISQITTNHKYKCVDKTKLKVYYIISENLNGGLFMKELYTKPEVDVEECNTMDVISTSSTHQMGGDDDD